MFEDDVIGLCVCVQSRRAFFALVLCVCVCVCFSVYCGVISILNIFAHLYMHTFPCGNMCLCVWSY